MQVGVVEARLTSELRRAVLRPHWPVGTAMFGDDDAGARHIAAIDDETVLCACVLVERPYPRRRDQLSAWQLRGMATADGLRNRGIGGLVVERAADEVTARGGRVIWCEARERAVPFYARHGFTAEADTYLNTETGLPHRFMWRELSPAATSSEQ